MRIVACDHQWTSDYTFRFFYGVAILNNTCNTFSLLGTKKPEICLLKSLKRLNVTKLSLVFKASLRSKININRWRHCIWNISGFWINQSFTIKSSLANRRADFPLKIRGKSAKSGVVGISANTNSMGLIDWCLTPTVAVFQLYRGMNKFYINFRHLQDS